MINYDTPLTTTKNMPDFIRQFNNKFSTIVNSNDKIIFIDSLIKLFKDELNYLEYVLDASSNKELSVLNSNTSYLEKIIKIRNTINMLQDRADYLEKIRIYI